MQPFQDEPRDGLRISFIHFFYETSESYSHILKYKQHITNIYEVTNFDSDVCGTVSGKGH